MVYKTDVLGSTPVEERRAFFHSSPEPLLDEGIVAGAFFVEGMVPCRMSCVPTGRRTVHSGHAGRHRRLGVATPFMRREIVCSFVHRSFVRLSILFGRGFCLFAKPCTLSSGSKGC